MAEAGSNGRTLAGQKALVTGASSGIGKAVAIALGRAGADVVVNYYSGEAGAQQAVEQITAAGSQAYAAQANVSREDQVQAMFRSMYDRFGTIDILVNNAGVQKDAAFDEMTLAEWQAVIDINLTGQFLCAREAIREFKRRGVVAEVSCSAGKIISISSVHELIPWAGHVNYAASKGGVMMMTRSIAQEVAPHRIRVNSIAPGAIRTPINVGHAGGRARPPPSDTLRTGRRTRRYWQGRRLARVGRFGVCSWRHPVRRRWHDPVP